MLRIDARMDGQKDGRTDGGKAGRTDGRTDRLSHDLILSLCTPHRSSKNKKKTSKAAREAKTVLILTCALQKLTIVSVLQGLVHTYTKSQMAPQ